MEWQWTPPAEVAKLIARALVGDPDPAAVPERTFPLTAFQEEGVVRVRGLLRRRGGAIVADDVGLGKTYIALALIEESLRNGDRAVLIVPSALRSTWTPLVRRVERSAGASTGTVHSVTHARLSRGTHDGRALAEAALVVVDEAHAFRNPASRRYRALAERGRDSALLLITATPVNNSVADLYHLVRQFASDDAFRDIGVASLRSAFLDSGGAVGAEPVGRVVREVVVRRTREDVRETSVDSRAPPGRFPERAPTLVVGYEDPLTSELVGAIERLELAPYGDSVGALLRLGLLKRLESGRPACASSLRRLRALLTSFADAAGKGRLLRPRDMVVFAEAADGDAVQLLLEEVVLDSAAPGVDLDRLARSARSDLELVTEAIRSLRGADPKLEALTRWVGDRDREKVVVFTEFRDTAAAVWRTLLPAGRVGRIDGSGAWLGSRRSGRGAVVERFAPVSNGARIPHARERVDLLVATDVLSEGMNLQDAGTVLCYDLPWNPVRLLQRIGRVDRLGSLHAVVQPVLFLPAAGLDDVLRLTRALRRKLGGIAATVGAAEAGELLEILSRGGAVDVLERIRVRASVDPIERLRRALQHAGPNVAEERPAGDTGLAEPEGARAAAARSARPRRPAASSAAAPESPESPESPRGRSEWLILGSDAGGHLHVFLIGPDGRVCRDLRRAADILCQVIEADSRGRSEGGTCPRPERRVVREAVAGAEAVLEHMRRRAAASMAPASLGSGRPRARLAHQLKGAVDELGPDPDPVLLKRIDALLRRLAVPLDTGMELRLERLVQAQRLDGGAGVEAPGELARWRRLVDRLEALLVEVDHAPSGPGEPAPERHPEPRILAALRVAARSENERVSAVDAWGGHG